MPTSVGPNTKGEENLVFGYDLGDVSNSYKGEPTTNLLSSPDNMTGTGWSLGNVPAEITITGNQPDPFGKNNAILFTVASNGGNYPHIRQNDKITGTTASHTISIWAKSVSGSTRLDLVCFRSSPWNTAFSKTVTLTTEWQKFEVTGTPLDTTGHRIYFMCQNVPSGTATQVLMAYPQAEQTSHATPFVAGTRSATQGLLDLTGNSTIDLSNVSFDSNAQMTFDGTNDGIDINSIYSGSTENSVTVEGIVALSTNQTSRIFISNYTQVSTPTGFGIGINDSLTNRVKWFTGNLGTTNTLTSTTTLVNNQYYHVVGTYNGSLKVLYINGVQEASATISNAINNTSTVASIGYLRYLSNQRLIGELPLARIYNRALTASEIQSNYNAIKGRFNI